MLLKPVAADVIAAAAIGRNSAPSGGSSWTYLVGPHLAVHTLKSYITMCDVGKRTALPNFRQWREVIFPLIGVTRAIVGPICGIMRLPHTSSKS